MMVQDLPRPGDLVALEAEECVELMQQAPWVRIGFISEGSPHVLPVNHLFYEDAIYFRTAPGSKLGAAAAGNRVAVEADGGDEETRVGWSVVAHGQTAIVTDAAVEERLFAQSFEPWALPDATDFWVRIDVASITGRRIVRS